MVTRFGLKVIEFFQTIWEGFTLFLNMLRSIPRAWFYRR